MSLSSLSFGRLVSSSHVAARALLVVGAVAFAAGCSGGSSSEGDVEPESADSEGALVTSLLPGVAAVEIDSPGAVKTIGAKAKVNKLMAAFKTNGPSPECEMRVAATQFKFFDSEGAEMAKGSIACMRGTITLKSGKVISVVTPPGGLGVVDEPLVPADALWGITKIDIGRPGQPGAAVSVTKKSAIDPILDELDVEQKIDTSAPNDRCLPSRALTFYRANQKVAYATYACDPGHHAGKIDAYFSFLNPGAGNAANLDIIAKGGITIRTAAIDAAAGRAE